MGRCTDKNPITISIMISTVGVTWCYEAVAIPELEISVGNRAGIRFNRLDNISDHICRTL